MKAESSFLLIGYLGVLQKLRPSNQVEDDNYMLRSQTHLNQEANNWGSWNTVSYLTTNQSEKKHTPCIIYPKFCLYKLLPKSIGEFGFVSTNLLFSLLYPAIKLFCSKLWCFSLFHLTVLWAYELGFDNIIEIIHIPYFPCLTLKKCQLLLKCQPTIKRWNVAAVEKFKCFCYML